VIRNETLLRSARTAAMPSRRSRHLRDALVSATCKLGRIDALNLCVFSGSQIIMMPCSENPPCFRLYTSPPAYFIFVNISCICYLVSLRSGMVERLKGAIGSREDRKKVHIPEHRARHRHLSTESSTTSSACAKFIGFRPLRSTYIRSSISQVLVKAKLDHLHLTRYFCRVQPYTSASSFIWHLRLYKSDIPLFFITSPTFNIASTAPW
jgi:hypothetical protein